MTEHHTTIEADDPFEILGIAAEASDDEIRHRYLELVKRFPPEREPLTFQRINAAFQMAKDPLKRAVRLLAEPDETHEPWADVINREKSNPPLLSPTILLSLGNRERT